MRKIPVELQLAVMEHLDTLDIIHLELVRGFHNGLVLMFSWHLLIVMKTCRDFHDLIAKSGKSVWKHCLRRHCCQNNLFWPPLNQLKLGAELKEACTRGYRLYKGYERAARADPHPTGDISCKVTKLSFQLEPKAAVEDLGPHDIYLIPGGRLLVTFHGQKWICV
jgi:hypothetical protein